MSEKQQPSTRAFTKEECENLIEGTRVVLCFKTIHECIDARYGRIIDASYQKCTIMLDEPHETGQYHTLTWDEVLKRVLLDVENNEHWRRLQQLQHDGKYSLVLEYMPEEKDLESCVFFTIGYLNGLSGGRTEHTSGGFEATRRQCIEEMYRRACIRGYIIDPSVYISHLLENSDH